LHLDGQNMYGPSPATAIPVGPSETRQFLNMNPPHFHLLILPLARLEPLPAFALWAGISLAALGLSLALIWRELTLRWTLSGIIWAVLAGVVWSATAATVVTGQLTFLLTLGVTLAWRAARRERWINAAIWLGVLASVKPFLGVFWLYFLVTRRFRPAAAMAGAAAVCFAVGLAVFGWEPHVDWLHALGGVTWSWAPMNASFPGLVARTLDASPLFVPTWQAESLVPLLSWLGAIALGLVTYREIIRTDRVGRTDRSFLLLLLMAQLVAPLGWVYYMWIAVGPLLAWWPTRSRGLAVTLLSIGALPGFLSPVVLTVAWTAPWATPTIGSVYFWMVLCVWSAVIRRDR